MTNGYEGFTEGPKPEDLNLLAQLATRLWDEQREVEKAEAALKKAQDAFRATSERDIPELMTKCGMKTFTTTKGLQIDIKDLIRASIPKANLVAAVDWLDKNGHGGLVKRCVFVEFPKEKEVEAKELAVRLRGTFSNVGEENTIHPSSLASFLRKELEAGHEVPLPLFGAQQYQRADIKVKKVLAGEG